MDFNDFNDRKKPLKNQLTHFMAKHFNDFNDFNILTPFDTLDRAVIYIPYIEGEELGVSKTVKMSKTLKSLKRTYMKCASALFNDFLEPLKSLKWSVVG